MANIVLNTKTYTGGGVANSIATYTERSSGVAAGFSPLTGTVRMDTKSRIQWKLGMPVIAAEASPCACPNDVVRRLDADLSIRFDPGATTAERTDFADRLKDLVNSAQFRASLISLEAPTG